MWGEKPCIHVVPATDIKILCYFNRLTTALGTEEHCKAVIFWQTISKVYWKYRKKYASKKERKKERKAKETRTRAKNVFTKHTPHTNRRQRALSSPRHPRLRRNGVVCCCMTWQRTSYATPALSMGITRQFFSVLSLVTLTFNLWPCHSSSSERVTKHVFKVNLAQIRSLVQETFDTHKKMKVTDGAKNRTLLACGKNKKYFNSPKLHEAEISLSWGPFAQSVERYGANTRP